MRLFLLFGYGFFLFPLGAWTQTLRYTVRPLQHIDGTVTGITAGKGDGELFIATHHAIKTLKGNSTTWRDSINGATFLKQDPKGNTWAATINSYNKLSSIVNLSNGGTPNLKHKNLHVTAFDFGNRDYENGQAMIYVGATEGLFRVTGIPPKRKFPKKNSRRDSVFYDWDMIQIQHVYDVCTDRENNKTWIGAKTGLYVLHSSGNIEKLQQGQGPNAEEINGIRAICMDEDYVFLASKDRLFKHPRNLKLSSANIKALIKEKTITQDAIRDIALDTFNKLWYVSDHVGFINLENYRVERIQDSLLETVDQFNRLYIESDRTVWIGTLLQGAFQLRWEEIEYPIVANGSKKLEVDTDVEVFTDSEGIPLEVNGIKVKRNARTFDVKGPVIDLEIKDAEEIDGDVVRVYLNGNIVLDNHTLTRNPYKVEAVKLNRQEGNYLVIETLGEGEQGEVATTHLTIHCAKEKRIFTLRSQKNESDMVWLKIKP